MSVKGDEDDKECPHRIRNPLESADVLSKCSFSWIYPLLKLGLTRPLMESDLPALHDLETSSVNRQIIEELWENEVRTGRRNFGRALFWHYFKTTWIAQILMAFNMAARIGQAMALGLLMEQFGRFEQGDFGDDSDSPSHTNTKKGYLYASLLVLCGLIAFPTKHQQFFITYRAGMQIRVGIVAALYAKMLRLPSVGGSAISSGHVTNLASNDVERFLSTSVTLIYLIQGPIIAVIILALGIQTIGPIFAVGYGLLLVLLPLQMYLGRRFASLRSKVAGSTDNRVGIISQAVNGVRVMKMNGWENEFKERIRNFRSEEINLVQQASRFKALNEAVYFCSAPVISVFIFAFHVWTGGTLTPRSVFTILTLMSIVQYIITKHLPNSVMGLSECYISCKRVQAFFELPEINFAEETEVNSPTSHDGEVEQRNVLSLQNVTCHWQPDLSTTREKEDDKLIKNESCSQDDFSSSGRTMVTAISDVSYTFKSNQLYCIIGKVGSGKSAFLQALTGEIPVSDGLFSKKFKSMSYAAQEPWIMDGSVRDNIIMGLQFNEKWYLEVVHACGLVPDINGFQNGDETIVGDRGVQCSGGQRARIGLARALYCDSEVLILDDPLSAVDSKVARSIYYEAIQNIAIKRRNKCVILVTHQHQFVGNSTCILMDEGVIRTSGSFSDCVDASNGSLIETLQVDESIEDGHDEEVLGDIDLNIIKRSHLAKDENTEDPKENINAEGRNTGIIARDTWFALAAELGGIRICCMFFIIFTATQCSLLVTIIQLGEWAEAPANEQNTPKWFIILLSLTALVILSSIFRAMLSFYALVETSHRLHDRMLCAVLRSKIEFFDTNPLGRILNRFSADIGITDETFPFTVYDFLVGLFIVIGGVVTAGIVLPFILLCIPPLLFFFFMLRRTFVSTSRELKRLEGLGRSPIFAIMNESLGGIATIRSNSKIGYFRQKFLDAHDAHSRAYFAFIATSRWFAFKLDVLAFVLTAAASLLAVLFNDRKWFDVDPSILGLALTLLIQISTTNFPWIIRQSAEVCNQMVSVERIMDFANITPEAPLTTNYDEDITKHWPEEAEITVKNLTIRYRSDLEPSLKNVSFKIKAGQKIGIVGRSGCGKSTLVQSIFRILEAENGQIEIGGIDISSLGLHKLRRAISVIIQSPVLFGGYSVRENLDPFGEFGVQNIREALEAVQMLDVIESLPQGLDTFLAEGGNNLSVGQRQLLCLARSLLKKSRILILDEPTANVDTNTDHLLQQTLKNNFSEATIVSVAHRLDTVIDYDQILVLGDGKILEYGSPAELLEDGESHFSSMVRNTGDSMADYLRKKAGMESKQE